MDERIRVRCDGVEREYHLNQLAGHMHTAARRFFAELYPNHTFTGGIVWSTLTSATAEAYNDTSGVKIYLEDITYGVEPH